MVKLVFIHSSFFILQILSLNILVDLTVLFSLFRPMNSMRELLINFPDIDIKNMKYEVWKIKLKFYRKFSNEAEVATLANSSIWYQSSSVVVHKCSLRATKVHSHIQYAEKSEMIERQYKYRCTGAPVHWCAVISTSILTFPLCDTTRKHKGARYSNKPMVMRAWIYALINTYNCTCNTYIHLNIYMQLNMAIILRVLSVVLWPTHKTCTSAHRSTRPLNRRRKEICWNERVQKKKK